MGESVVSRRLPITAFGGEIQCRSAAGDTLPGPLREAPSRHHRFPHPNALGGIAHG
jgi:hypothetical protein